MATTHESLNNDQEEFNRAFAEPEQERPEISEDEAFGLGPEAAEDAGDSGDANDGAAVAIVIDPNPEDHAVEDEQAEPAVEQSAEESTQSEEAAGEPDEPPMDEKELQRQRSWEGRLKAREAELAAREAALKSREAAPADADDANETPAEEASESPATEAIEQAAEQVASGDMTVEQALKSLSADFGEDFAKMLGVLISAKAEEVASKIAGDKMGDVSSRVDELISGITNDKARAHFEAIAERHPDFMDVSGSDQMKGYLDSLPEADRAHAEQVIASGTAKQINQLLDAVKAHGANQTDDEPAPQVDPDQSDAMDAAEGVRSSGIKLPEKPRQADDYESAWNQF